MIHANNPISAAQQFNRKKWLEHAEANLSNQIMVQACKGLRQLNVCLHDITKGAENLAEIGEMCILLHKTLTNQGYTVKYTINGNLTISW